MSKIQIFYAQNDLIYYIKTEGTRWEKVWLPLLRLCRWYTKRQIRKAK